MADPDTHSAGVGELSFSRWRASLGRNLDTAFLVTRAALPAMRTQGWGRVIMVSSVTGPIMAAKGEVAYSAAKAGIGLARALALEVAGDGITLNAVAPGWIRTGSQTGSEAREGSATPIGRSGLPDEVASAIAWLATPGASYLTGQCIAVDGKQHLRDAARPKSVSGAARQADLRRTSARPPATSSSGCGDAVLAPGG